MAQIKDLGGEMSALIWLVENIILQKRFAQADQLAQYGQQRCLEHQLPNEESQFQRMLACRGNS